MIFKPKGEEYRSTTVCVDSYRNRILSGRLYNRYMSEGRAFHGTTQFLIEMEQMLDDMDFPKAYTEIRRFTPPTNREAGPAESKTRMGAVATFVVRILFRQNASWQGSVIWVEGRQEQSFRSALELILLLDDALGYEKAS